MSRADQQTPDVYRRASDLYSGGRFEEALECYKALTDSGAVGSRLRVGWMYEHGLGTAADPREALRWYESAVDAQPAEAFFYIGKFHLAQCRAGEAQRFFEQAASLGFSPALFRLGRMHQEGTGVPVDAKRAVEYFETGAKLGNLFAERELCRMMIRGEQGLAQIPKGICQLARVAWKGFMLAMTDENDHRLRT